jgi:hypothetical protein
MSDERLCREERIRQLELVSARSAEIEQVLK